jgi:hypothetical protein
MIIIEIAADLISSPIIKIKMAGRREAAASHGA